MAEYNGLDAFEQGFLAAVAEAEANFLQELADEAKKTWSANAATKLQATAKHYQDNLQVEASDHAVTITVPAGIPSAVDAGTNKFDLKPGFLNPKSKSLLLERAPGDIRWRTLTGTNKRIPLDGGWPEKIKGSNWKHKGIDPRDITPDSTKQIQATTLPKLLGAFVSKVTV